MSLKSVADRADEKAMFSFSRHLKSLGLVRIWVVPVSMLRREADLGKIGNSWR